MVLACFLRAGADVSLFLPYLIFSIAGHYGDGPSSVKKAIVQYLLCLVVPAIFLDLFLLPLKPFRSSTEEIAEQTPLFEDPEAPKTKQVIEKKKNQSTAPYFHTLGLGQQLKTLDIWLFVLLLVFAFARKKHFSLMIRPIMMELDNDPAKTSGTFYANLFNQLVPVGFIPAILWGALVDKFGINACMFSSNTLGIIFCTTALIPWMPLQLFTVVVYILYQCFILGQTLAFTASVYGFGTVATLQGICCSITGVFSLIMDFFWPDFVNHTLGSYRAATVIFLVIGFVLYIFPLFLTIRERRRRAGEVRLEEEENILERLLPSAPVFDTNSLGVLSRKSSVFSTYR